MAKVKPLDLPSAVARAFVKDMRAYFTEENRYNQDEIALRQLHALKEFQGVRDKKLRLRTVPADASLSEGSMAKVTVYRIKRYAPSPESEENIPNRWFTKKGAELVGATHVFDETAIEIDDKDLETGSQWTPIDYQPQGT